MRIGFLVFNLDGMGGTSRSAITQAQALLDQPDVDGVRLLSVVRSAETSHYDLDPRVEVEYLVDLRRPDAPRCETPRLSPADAARLHGRESALVPARWDRQFTALCDVALEAALPALDLDVLVTVTPGLLAAAVQLAPKRTAVVHQEHRSSSDRTSGMEPLLAFAPRADAVALLTESVATWLRETLGDLAPTVVVMPNPLPMGFTPRSTLDTPRITAAGRLVPEKQFARLIAAFAQVADALPGWRLRICGDGPQRPLLGRQVRRLDLWDRVEFPGAVPDMRTEWATSAIAALSSRTEGYPLVAQEAMAAGVPVVSFDCPSGPREIVRHEIDGLLVAPQSVPGLASALQRLGHDRDLRHRLGAAARDASARWEATAIARQWTAIFAEAIARRRVPTPHRPLPVPVPEPAHADGVTPADARRQTLRLAVDVVRGATDTWLVLPAHDGPHPIVVSPMAARDDVLAGLADAAVPTHLCLRDPALHSWPERRGRVAELAAELRRGRTAAVVLEPWRTAGAATEIQFWETAPDGTLAAPCPNRYASRFALTTVRDEAVDADVDGVRVRSLPWLLAPTATEVRFPIDIVYTWVDGTDPAWCADRDTRLAELPADHPSSTRAAQSSGANRYADRGELRASMRSVHLYAPWVRTLHVVTAGQVPGWLDVEHPRVNLVHHRDVLPPEALPTFNSHAIETALHRIDGLAEHFVYLNDDVLLTRPLRPERFFSPGGVFSAFVSDGTLESDPAVERRVYLEAGWTGRDLLFAAFGAAPVTTIAHTPHPHRVSVLHEVAERFPDAWAATARNPFRSGTDVAPLSSLAQYYGLLTGTAVAADPALAYVDLGATDVEGQLARTRGGDVDFCCLGDNQVSALTPDRIHAVLHDFFTSAYPEPAPWELAPA